MKNWFERGFIDFSNSFNQYRTPWTTNKYLIQWFIYWTTSFNNNNQYFNNSIQLSQWSSMNNSIWNSSTSYSRTNISSYETTFIIDKFIGKIFSLKQKNVSFIHLNKKNNHQINYSYKNQFSKKKFLIFNNEFFTFVLSLFLVFFARGDNYHHFQWLFVFF